jgi:xylulose-5-phosphate/fructose-6-phosphate phosphoketolase
MCGYGYRPYFVEGDDPAQMHQLMAATFDDVLAEIKKIQHDARAKGSAGRAATGASLPCWPMIVMKTPKAGPVQESMANPRRLVALSPGSTLRTRRETAASQAPRKWMRSYKHEELFDKTGRLKPEIAELAPTGDRRMGANPHANGGKLLRDLKMPDFCDYAVAVPRPGSVTGEATRVLGGFLRDVIKLNEEQRNFRIFGPDETESNRLTKVFEATNRVFEGEILKTDEHIARDGRVIEVKASISARLARRLSPHGSPRFLLLLRSLHPHRRFHVQSAREIGSSHSPFLASAHCVSELTLTSHVWRRDHNGFSHQDPGFIDHVMNKAEIIRVYLPPDANTLLSVADHLLASRHYASNVIVAGKQPRPNGSTWIQPSNIAPPASASGHGPAMTMAMGRRRHGCAGDVPTSKLSLPSKCCDSIVLNSKSVSSISSDIMTLQPRSNIPRPDRCRLRCAFTKINRHFRLSRLSVVNPSPDLSPHQPQKFPCPRL